MATDSAKQRAIVRGQFERLLVKCGWNHVINRRGEFFVKCLESFELDDQGIFYWITIAGCGKRLAGLAWDSLPIYLNGAVLSFPNGTTVQL